MRAARADLERAAHRLLPHNVGKINASGIRIGQGGAVARGELRAAPQMREPVAQPCNRIDRHALGKRGFVRVVRGDEHRRQSGVTGGERHGQRARDRAHVAGQRQLPEKGAVRGRRVDLPARREQREQNGQVVDRALLFGVGGGEVDRYARHRPVEAAGFDRCAHAFARLADRFSGQTDHIQTGQTAR